jgi:hypothetical protein
MHHAADSYYLKFCILIPPKRMNHTQPKDSNTTPAKVGKRPGEHVWTHGGDVQSVWKKYGWTPPSKQGADTPSRHRLRDQLAANNALRVLRG